MNRLKDLQNKQMISVIIPTYKNRGGLTKSIDSVLSQDCDMDFEVIVVDDNSPEFPERKQTEKLMHNYDSDERVKYIKHIENKNGAAARNTGIKASKGEYIAFLDDDDFFLPGKLQVQKDYLNQHLEYAATYCLLRRGGRIVNSYPYKGNIAKELLMMKTVMPTSTLMFRREAIESINGFDESFRRHQDYEMLLRFFRQGYQMGCVEMVLEEMGLNNGENVLGADKMFQMKQNFLRMFAKEIDDYDQETPGFKRYVYGKHFTALFFSYLKESRIGKAMIMMAKAIINSPKAFWEDTIYSIKYHLKN